MAPTARTRIRAPPGPHPHPAEQPGGVVGQHPYRLLQRHQLPAAQAVPEEADRVRGPAHPVQVGARVGAAEHDVLVPPGLGAQGPGVRVVVGGHRPEHGAQFVGRADLHQARERVLAPFGGDVPYDASGQALVGGAVGVADDVPAEVGEAPEHARLLGVGAAQHLLAGRGGARGGDPLGHGQGEDRSPAGDEVERAERAQRHVHRGEDRHGETCRESGQVESECG